MRWNVALAGAFLLASTAQGAVRHVPSEYATINAALNASVAGDTVLVAPGTYSDYETRVLQGGGPFTASCVAFLKTGVSLVGEGGRDVTRIDLAGQGTGNAVPVMGYGLGAGTLLVQGFTITGAPAGNAGMWGRFVERTVIRDCRFEDLDGGMTDSGGLFSETTDLEVHGTDFVRCQASNYPAALLNGEGDVTLSECFVRDCTGSAIVGLNAGGVSPPFHALVQGCEFQGNVGTAAVVLNFVTLTIEDCVFVGNSADYTSALSVSGGSGGIVEPGPYYVRHNLFANNHPSCMHYERVSGTVEGNTFVGNGEALTLSYQAEHEVSLIRNIFAGTDGLGVWAVASTPAPTLQCNVFWENTGGHTEGFPLDPTDVVADPLFCGSDSGDYTVAENSPCIPPQSGLCGQIGALGEGCSGVAIELETWARMKVRYRTGSDGREEP